MEGKDEKEAVLSAEERLKKFQMDAQRRENILVMRLATKEQEVQEFYGQLEELRTNISGGLKNTLLDPVINSMFLKMKDELKECKTKYDQCQQELNSWKFTPDSNVGKKLMLRCRTLIQENEDLGKMIESGKLAKIEGQVALTQKNIQDSQTSQSDTNDLLVELDQDMEGLQAALMTMQNQMNLKDALIARYEKVLEQNGLLARDDNEVESNGLDGLVDQRDSVVLEEADVKHLREDTNNLDETRDGEELRDDDNHMDDEFDEGDQFDSSLHNIHDSSIDSPPPANSNLELLSPSDDFDLLDDSREDLYSPSPPNSPRENGHDENVESSQESPREDGSPPRKVARVFDDVKQKHKIVVRTTVPNNQTCGVRTRASIKNSNKNLRYNNKKSVSVYNK